MTITLLRGMEELFGLDGIQQKFAAIKVIKVEVGCNSQEAIELIHKHTLDGELDVQGLNDELVPQSWRDDAEEEEAEHKEMMESIKPGWQMLLVNCLIDEDGNIAETKEYEVFNPWAYMPRG